MKKLMSVLLFLIAYSEYFSQSQLSTIQQGNSFYKKQNYEKALESYSKIIKQGYVSPELYFNIANAYYRLNKLGYSILYYEKALRLSPNDEDIQFNLKLAKTRTVDKLEEFPKIFLTVWWEFLVSLLSFKSWSIVFIFFFWVLLISLGLYLVGTNLSVRKLGFYISSFTFAFLILISIIFYESYLIEVRSAEGILINESEVVKQAPDIQSGDAFIVHEGIKFTCEDEVDGWTKIKLIDGKLGWISNKSFRKI